MRLPHRFLAVFALSTAVAFGAPPLLEKTDLFEAGKDGYALYRIPGIVVTKKGTALAYCEARKDAKGDWGPIDVVMRRSTDGAKTWSAPQIIVKVEGELPVNPAATAQNLDKPGDNTVNNPVAIVDHETGAVHFLYCLEYMRCFYLRSDDDGATWSKAVEITPTFEQFRADYDWKVLATGPAHGIQLTRGERKGRLVVPVWLSTGTGGHAHRPSVTSTIYSDDHGATWQRGEIAVPNTEEWVFPNETSLFQMLSGTVMLNVRTESKNHRRLLNLSRDGATQWAKPRFDDALLEPICMGSIVRYSQRPIIPSGWHASRVFTPWDPRGRLRPPPLERTMNTAELRQSLQAGDPVFGKLIVSPTPRWPEVLRGCGLDFVFIDTEHIALDRAQLSWMCQAYAALGRPPLVRIPSPDPFAATMVLDGGAAGVIAPYVESVEQARRSSVKRAPRASARAFIFEVRSSSRRVS